LRSGETLPDRSAKHGDPNGEVGAEFQRPADRRAGERIVDQQPSAARVRQSGQPREIRNSQQRVGDRLDDDQLRILPHRGRDGAEIACID
jgi:hypothetical protein